MITIEIKLNDAMEVISVNTHRNEDDKKSILLLPSDDKLDPNMPIKMDIELNNEAQKGAEKILTWLTKRWRDNNIAISNIRQSVHYCKTKKNDVIISYINILEKRGILKPNKAGIKVRGRKSYQSWRITLPNEIKDAPIEEVAVNTAPVNGEGSKQQNALFKLLRNMFPTKEEIKEANKEEAIISLDKAIEEVNNHTAELRKKWGQKSLEAKCNVDIVALYYQYKHRNPSFSKTLIGDIIHKIDQPVVLKSGEFISRHGIKAIINETIRQRGNQWT